MELKRISVEKSILASKISSSFDDNIQAPQESSIKCLQNKIFNAGKKLKFASLHSEYSKVKVGLDHPITTFIETEQDLDKYGP